jgi:hypothetical protein
MHLKTTIGIIAVSGSTGGEGLFVRRVGVRDVDEEVRRRGFPLVAALREHHRAFADAGLAVPDDPVPLALVCHLRIEDVLDERDETACVIHHQVWHHGVVSFGDIHTAFL